MVGKLELGHIHTEREEKTVSRYSHRSSDCTNIYMTYCYEANRYQINQSLHLPYVSHNDDSASAFCVSAFLMPGFVIIEA